MKLEQNREKVRLLLHLIPALLTGTLVFGLAAAPTLQAVPQRLTLSAQAAEIVEETLPAETIAAETAAPEALAQAVGDYPDGVYTGSAQGYGGTISVEVTVEEGQITQIQILSASGETESFFNRAKGVIDSILQAQTWEVDGVSGATYSSDGIKGAVENALTGETVVTKTPDSSAASPVPQSTVTYTEPANGYQDGVYTGTSTGFGGNITVQVTISGGKITKAVVTSAPGETPSYLTRAESVLNAVVSAQSPNVDSVSGATYSSNGILNAVKQALRSAAASGDTEEVPEETLPAESEAPTPDLEVNPGFSDGTYTGTAEGFGGDITVQVTVSEGRITQVKLISAGDETPIFLERASILLEQITAQQSWELDAVSGATYTSQGILQATAQAMAGAMPGEPEEPTPEESQPTETLPAESQPTETLPTESQPAETTPPESDPPETQVEVETAHYTGRTQVEPDEYQDFSAYTMTVEVEVTTETTVNAAEGTQTVVRTVTNSAITMETDNTTNQRLTQRAWATMILSLPFASTAAEVDGVSGATCSSEAIRIAWNAALSGVELGTFTTTLEEPNEGL